MGSFSNPSTPGNNVVVYWTDNLTSGNPTWHSLALDTANLGAWEPTYDSALWASQNKLALFYEQVGLNGETVATLKVLEWDEQRYFTPVPEPTSILLLSAAAGALMTLRRARVEVDVYVRPLHSSRHARFVSDFVKRLAAGGHLVARESEAAWCGKWPTPACNSTAAWAIWKSIPWPATSAIRG